MTLRIAFRLHFRCSNWSENSNDIERITDEYKIRDKGTAKKEQRAKTTRYKYMCFSCMPSVKLQRVHQCKIKLKNKGYASYHKRKDPEESLVRAETALAVL